MSRGRVTEILSLPAIEREVERVSREQVRLNRVTNELPSEACKLDVFATGGSAVMMGLHLATQYTAEQVEREGPCRPCDIFVWVASMAAQSQTGWSVAAMGLPAYAAHCLGCAETNWAMGEIQFEAGMLTLAGAANQIATLSGPDDRMAAAQVHIMGHGCQADLKAALEEALGHD
ncbi:hypothetical protein FDJ57_gp63 [Gordonia phage Sour]|uniref:Uncharacterized protein n=1 Tax=Gordonia phage Sour TaxID=2182349 RepID=A0A2U8UKJ8_9CAUD|nr:hypothetical protein FDJ57_gp63 [Gordonia phage Sour]AWN04264.1 hypothetical protein PBI_SOUR_63 [Gordonia phage Sour]